MKKRLTNIALSASITATYMKAKLRQTLVATAGVAFGITVFIFMVSFIQGTNEYTQDVVFQQSPHLRMYNEVQIADQSLLDRRFPGVINQVHHQKPKDILLNLKDVNQVLDELRADPRVQAASGAITTQVFFRLGSSSLNGKINGVDLEREDQLFNLSGKVIEGSYEEVNVKTNSILMGVGLAKRLNVTTGDQIIITTEKGGNFAVIVVGIFKTGLTDIDKQQCYASIKTVQKLLGVPASYLTEIKVKLFDKELAPEMSGQWQARYHYQGSDWKKDNASLLEGDVLRRMIVYGVAGTILLVAGFGIFNILTMMIYEKMKEIAILKATGFSDSDVRGIFLTQALVIGAAGAVMGLVFGFLISYAVSKVPFNSDVMITLDHLPVSFKPVYYITGFTFGILTTALSGYLPSRKAAKMDPISILRG
ncbi:ABC transporter permease [Dyadobacter jiangsuensis]|uniref:Lipoprotein-releasing system permease protein n=1 Tax=Dyadobacter jiangsuensis TaxID=1591085 RepID=A0A2P8FCP5_9BACT|nr:FtsX-like permease family protein [Dyadobacter jiangsuensis]PSL19503.1 lipoprotein-releasing system permease protein [Dyadobacter jiangsuensis]